MKSLRQLLRRPLHSSSATGTPKRRATQRHRSGNLNRRLSTQTLEQRQMLAGDIQIAHNYWNGYDVNEDRQISPSDALGVINYLSATTAQGEGTGAAVDEFVGRKVDVNADGNVTPSDALSVINALARGEQMAPLVEYFLTARDANDNLLPENGGVIEVGTGQENSFFLEVAYSDLRGFGDDKGAFSIFPDIGISQANALRPVLHEAQQLLIGEEIRQSTTGFLTIGREGSVDTVDITLGQLGAGDFRSAVSDALINTWGLNASDFVITEPLALKGENGKGLGLQIQYVADNFGNVDIPNLTITENFDNAVTVEVREFAPFEADGVTPNSAAVRFNLDVRSRTLSTQSGNNVSTNVAFYTNLHRGTFSLANGFTDIGGVGGASSVREVDKDGQIVEPFDAFRIEVFLANPVSSSNPLVIDVNPGEGVDPLTLYGSDGVVPEDLITIDEDARLTFSTGAIINNPPVLGTTPLTPTVSEDDGSTNVDLLQDATDADNDTLSVTGFSFTSGNTSGVTQTGSTVTINPAVYNALKVGESEVIVGTYTVTDGFAGSPTQNLTITITGANDAPVVTAAISETHSENAAQFTIDLLQNASDPDGDTLDATAIAQVGNEDNSGVTIDDTNNQLVVNPAAYAALETGQSIVLTYNFTVTDGNGGDTNSSVTITINGDTPNRDPVVTGPVILDVSEDDADQTLNLLDNASDPDTGDGLAVSGLTLVSGNAAGIIIDGETLFVSPSTYNALGANDVETIIYSYTISDGKGGAVDQTATVTINGANDAPVVTAAISETRSENAAQFTIDLLQNASDPDNDALDATGIVQVGNDDNAGVAVDDANNQLVVTPAAYAALETGQSVTLTYNFTVTDGNGGDTDSTVTITINGDTPNRDPIVSGPVTLAASEDDADLTLNLLDNASDPDTGDVLIVTGLSRVSGNAAGITENGNTLSVSPTAYNALGVSDVETIVYSYTISDSEGGSVAQTATITIGGANDAPTVGDAIAATVSEDDASTTDVDLLSGASDPDAGDTVAVDNLTRVSGDDTGVSDGGNGTLTVDPSAYNSLAAGESEVIIYTYNVVDSNGGVTAQSATITITGVNDAPTVGDAVTAAFTEDDALASVDLLTGASDVDASDVLKASNLTTTSGDSTPFSLVNSDTTIQFDPNFYNSLAAGESEIVVLTYNVEDGNGGSASQTATITINGVNDAPDVGNPLSFTFVEDNGTQIASLLDGATDADTSDTLTVSNVSSVGDDSGIARTGADLSIDTSAYGALDTGEQAVVVFTYNVSDGTTSVNQTATVTIEGRDEGIPVVSGPIIVSFDENDASANVDLLAGASDPDSDPISVINATLTSGDARGVTIDAPNNRLVVTPSAYADLDDGENEVVVVDYQITDDQGNTVDQTATVTIVGHTIVLSTISGELFVDHIENINDVINGAEPVRNGIKENDESALGSVTILLKQMTDEGEVVIKSVLTDNDGNYSFTGLLPGTYIVEYLIPDSVQYTGSKRGVVVIGELGGESKSGPDLDAIGLTGVQQRLNLLVKSYLAAGVLGTEQLSGGSVQLNADGTQQMFVAEDGFDAKFAEIALNDARDSALLTIIDANDVVRTAQLSVDQFVVTKDSRGVRFFGKVEDYDFSITPNQVLRDEFDDYRKAIDKALGDGA